MVFALVEQAGGAHLRPKSIPGAVQARPLWSGRRFRSVGDGGITGRISLEEIIAAAG